MLQGQELFSIVAEDDELLVINKPAGLVCHPTKGDEYSSLISRARLYLGAAQPPHLINRLDRETSGIVVVAKELEAAVKLRKLWESGQVVKRYWAIVHGHAIRISFSVEAPIGPDTESTVSIKDKVCPGGATARTDFTVLKRFSRPQGRFTLLRCDLHTGRKHQIRIHLQHAGHPLVGDKLYGHDELCYLRFVREELTAEDRRKLIFENHALHSGELEFYWRGVHRRFACPPEPWFTGFIPQ